MKKQSGKLTFAYMITAGAVLGLSGCGLTEPAAGVYGPPPSSGVEDDVDEPMLEVYGPPEDFEIDVEEPEDDAEEHYDAGGPDEWGRNRHHRSLGSRRSVSLIRLHVRNGAY